MDSEGSEGSGSFVVHSEGSGSVVVHDVPDDSGLSVSFAGVGGRGGGGGVGGSSAIVAVKNGLGAVTADGLGRGDAFSTAGNGEVGGAAPRRLPRPKPVPRWSQVPRESQPGPAPYLLNRYGRGGGGLGAAATSPVGALAPPSTGGLGDSLDAFKLYVADDGEMKMGDHHNDFYGFNYDPADDADDLVNLQHRQLSANGGDDGDFYVDTEDSSYGSSDVPFKQQANLYQSGGEAVYENSEAGGGVTDRQSWAIEPALLTQTVSRRRRLPLPKRRGGGGGRGGTRADTSSGGDHASKRKGRRTRHRVRGRTAATAAYTPFSGQASRDGGGTARMPAQPSRSFSAINSTLRRNGRSNVSTARHPRMMACVRPGAHVAAAAAAYPHLPASLGALVLLSPGNPTTTPLEKVTRLRRHLLQRQRDEEREYERKQRARNLQEAEQPTPKEAVLGTTAAAAALPFLGSRMSPRAPGSPRHPSGANSHSESAHSRATHPVSELKFSFEDLNRSTGPGTARMGAGASLAILRSARQRMKESPRLQEVALKGEAVYVRADPVDVASAAAAAATARRSDAGTQKSCKPSFAGLAEAADGATGGFAARQPRELRDPYSGVVIASSTASGEEDGVQTVSLSCAAGVPFFHDPTAPRPIAVADVVRPQPQPQPQLQLAVSEGNSMRELSPQTSLSAPPSPATPITTYVPPSSLQQPQSQAFSSVVLRSPSKPRHSSVQSSSSHGGSHSASVVPTVHFPPPLPVAAAAASLAEQRGANAVKVVKDSETTLDSSINPTENLAGRHARTETDTYCDARFALLHPDGDSSNSNHPNPINRREAFLESGFPHLELNQRTPSRAPVPNTSITGAEAALAAGEYRMPSAIASGSGQRQRWRPHGGSPGAAPATSGFDGGANSLFHAIVNGSPPPWRWLHGPPPPSTSFSTTSSVSGGSRGGQRWTHGREAAVGAVGAMDGHNTGSLVKESSGGVHADPAATTTATTAAPAATLTQPPMVFNLRGFTNACEANLVTPCNTVPSPHVWAPVALQLPLYPSLVAPYAAPRNPLQQNIRYNAWTADGVSASSGAACIVHVFTITRAMLRDVYEYVAYACARQRELAARERRMRDALAAGVLTRDLQRCLRCPHCGAVGQIVKAALPRNTSQSQAQHPLQPFSQTPRQLSQSQSQNQVRGMSSSQHGCPALCVSVSASNFSLEGPRQPPPPPQQQQQQHSAQTERGKHVLLSTDRLTPRRSNMRRLPHAFLSPSTGGSTTHSCLVHNNANTNVSVHDAVVMEVAGRDILHEGAAVALHGAARESAGLCAVDAGPAATGTVGVREGREASHEIEGCAVASVLSAPTMSGLCGPCSSLPPLPPMYAVQHTRLLSPTQNAPITASSEVPFAATPSSIFSSSQQQQPQSSAASTSRFVPLGAAAVTTPPIAPVGTPNKLRPSPTFTGTATTATTVDSAEGNAENALERSSGSRELSQSFVASQPQRTSNSQPDFQRYAASLLTNSGTGGVLANGLLSNGSYYNLSHSNLQQRMSQEREESSVRVESRGSDAAPAVLVVSSSNSVGVSGRQESAEEQRSEQRQPCQHTASAHASLGPMQRAAMSPPQASYSSLSEGYMTPPTASLLHLGFTSPNPVEFTFSMNASAALAIGGGGGGSPGANAPASAGGRTPSTRRVLSPSSTSSLPVATNTLPPPAVYGGNSPFSTLLSASTMGQATRPPPPPPRPSSAQGNRGSANGSFLGSTQASMLTPAVPPLASSSVPLIGEGGVHSSSAQPRDSFAESMNAAVNRNALGLARRYVCQSCHREVVPKTSMVQLTLLEDRLLSKSVSEVTTPTLTSDRADAARVSEPFGVLAFEDLLQDDALVHALQTYLQESIMLPATRPSRPSRAASTPLAPEASAAVTMTTAASAAHAPSASMVSMSPHLVPNGSLVSDIDGPPKTEMKSPTLPSVTPAVAGRNGAGGAKAAHSTSVDASSRVQLPGALRHGVGDAVPHNSELGNSTRLQWPPSQRPAVSQASMPSFARLSLKSLSSSSPSSSSSTPSSLSAASSARPKMAAAVATANEEKHGSAIPANELHPALQSTVATAAPLLLRLCVPCCGLKVSVLSFAKPAAPTPRLSLENNDDVEQETPAGKAAATDSAESRTPLQRRRSAGSGTVGRTGDRRLPRKLNCVPPPTIPRMREDAATRGLTQSALPVKKKPPVPKRGGRKTAAAAAELQRRRRCRPLTVASVASAAAARRMEGHRGEKPVEAAASASQEVGNSSKTVMKDTDASKRHRVQVNARVHLDATSIDRIWERVFTQDKSSAVAAVAAGRDRARAKRLKAFVEEAAHTPPAKAKSAAELPRLPSIGGAPPTEPLVAAADDSVARNHQHLGIDLDTYADSSLVLKVELAYPRLPNGNVRQLLEEWVATCQPHPVLLEAVIRNIVYGVLTQLHALHTAGYTSGHVKSTNVFPMWHLMKATEKAGMKMPPRAAAAADGRAVGGRKNERDVVRPARTAQHSFGVAASASMHSRDGLQSVERFGCSATMDSVPHQTEDDVASPFLQPRRSVILSPTLMTQQPMAKETMSLSISPAQSVGGSISMPGIHAMEALAAPFGAGKVQQPLAPGTATHRHASFKAPERTAAGDSRNNNSNNNRDGGGTDRVRESDAPPDSNASHSGVAPLSAALVTMSDAQASPADNSGSGSCAFPFSPTFGVTPSAPRRRGRSLSIDENVFFIESRRKSNCSEAAIKGSERRTRSAGPVNAQRRRSGSTRSRSRVEEEEEDADLVPVLVEMVAPPSTAAVAAAQRKSDPLMSAPLTKTAGTTTAPHPPVSTAESVSSAASRHGPQWRDRCHSTNINFKFAGNESAALAEEAQELRCVRGARLIPPARVLLPSLRSCVKGGEASQGRASSSQRDKKSSSSKATSVRLPKEASGGGDDDVAGSVAMRDETQSLLMSAPTGAVPRPKSRQYSHAGSSFTKTTAAGRGSKNKAERDGISSGDGDALDPLQWSQQVMLVDNLGSRVETALRRAMTAVLTHHPPCPARAVTTEDKGKGSGKGDRSTSNRTPSLLSPTSKELRLPPRRIDSGAAEAPGPEGKNEASHRFASPRERAAASAFTRSRPQSGSADGKALNVYVPDPAPATPPVQPVLFGIQEAEYVPAPETIRTPHDEAKALWRLWRQQQYSGGSARPDEGKDDSTGGVDTADDSEKAEMAYVVAQLAGQACPATTLRNTLDPYPSHTPAVDVWQLGMLALDLADGPVPTTWLKQREPTPRLNSYPWSSYFQSFVSRCLQVAPERRATVAELLQHPWFRVALVPQVTGGGGGGSGDGCLRQPYFGALSSTLRSLPPRPRVPCVMGVDCLTAEEEAEWEEFDYTLLYASEDGLHPLAASPVSPASGMANGISRLRRASTNSPSASVKNATGQEKAGATTVAAGGSTAGLGAASTGNDSIAISQSLGISGRNHASGVSFMHAVASPNSANHNNNSTNNNSDSVNAAIASAVDAEFSAMPSVDLAQYFTRLATLQWRWQQQQQQQLLTSSLAALLPETAAHRSSGGGVGSFAGLEVGGPTGLEVRGMSNALLNNFFFFEHSLPVKTEDVLAMLRQSSSNTRYLQLSSPRQNLYKAVSPHSPRPAAAGLSVSQAQQTDNAAPTPLLWGYSSGASLSGAPYSLPSALSAARPASPSPPGPSASSAGPVARGDVSAIAGLPATYVPLRDPRVGGAGNALVYNSNSNAATTSGTGSAAGAVTSGYFASPRCGNIWREFSTGATVMTSSQGSQHASSTPLLLTSGQDMRAKFTTGAAAGNADKCDPRWKNFSDVGRPIDREDAEEEEGSGSSFDSSDSEDSDTGGFSFEGHSSRRSSSSSSNSSAGLAKRKSHSTGCASSGAQSSRNSDSYASSLDDAYLANRGGGEVPYRRCVVVSHDAPGSRRTPATQPSAGVRLSREGAWQASETSGQTNDAEPHNMPASVSPFNASVAAGHAVAAMHERRSHSRRAVNRCRPRRLLLGTIATSLARLSTVVASASDLDDDDDDDDDDDSNSSIDSVTDDEGGHHSVSDSFPDSFHRERRRTQNFRDTIWEDVASHSASNPMTANTARRVSRHSGTSRRCARSAFTPLSSLTPYVHTRSEKAISSDGDDAACTAHSENDSSSSDAQDDIEVRCDEVLRCFSALQRNCPMAVSLWCLRMWQQATAHPRTSAAGTRLLARVERSLAGGAAEKNLAWLSAAATAPGTTAERQRHGEDVANATASTRSTVAAATTDTTTTTPSPQTTEPSVLDTCPSSFHNYELAKWLYAAHQAIPRCI